MTMLHLNDLVSSLESRGKALQVLKLNHLNLGTDFVIEAIANFIEMNPYINILDLAFCSLGAKEMLEIAKVLKTNPDHVKSLNFSYNQLLVNEDYEENLEDELEIKKIKVIRNSATEFLKFMTSYISKTKTLNHLDLSGL